MYILKNFTKVAAVSVVLSGMVTSNTSYAACDSYSPERILEKASRFAPHIQAAVNETQVPENLIIAVMTAESCFKTRARSPKGAAGLMQLMPATARRFGVKNRYRHSSNIKGGARYLRFLLQRFRGDLRKTIAAYNAGEGRIDQYNGLPPFRETHDYVKRVLNVLRKMDWYADQSIKNRHILLARKRRQLIALKRQQAIIKRRERLQLHARLRERDRRIALQRQAQRQRQQLARVNAAAQNNRKTRVVTAVTQAPVLAQVKTLSMLEQAAKLMNIDKTVKPAKAKETAKTVVAQVSKPSKKQKTETAVVDKTKVNAEDNLEALLTQLMNDNAEKTDKSDDKKTVAVIAENTATTHLGMDMSAVDHLMKN